MMGTEMERRPKVLLVDMMSGANDYGRELTQALAQVSNLTVITVNNAPLQPSRELRVLPVFPAFGSVGGNRWGKLLQTVHAFKCLFKELYTHRNAVVHVQYFRFPILDLIIYGTARVFLSRLVFTAHNALPHEQRWWHRPVYRWWYRTVDRIHVLSRYAKEQIKEFARIDDAKVVVIPHGNYASLVDRTRHVDLATGLNIDLPVGNVVAVLFGLIREYKGVDLLINAVRRLPESMPVTFVVTGGGRPDLMERYQQDAAAYGLTDRIRFISHFYSDDELAALMQRSDLTVFPYRHIYQSGALMLAMSFGCAIIASDLDGFKEYVDDGIHAILCDTTDPEVFAAELTTLIEDRARRARLGAAAKARAINEFDWNHIARALLTLYGR